LSRNKVIKRLFLFSLSLEITVPSRVTPSIPQALKVLALVALPTSLWEAARNEINYTRWQLQPRKPTMKTKVKPLMTTI